MNNEEFLNVLKSSDKPSIKRFAYLVEREQMLEEYMKGKEGKYYYDSSIPLNNLFVFPEVKDKDVSLNEWRVFIQQCLDNAQCEELYKLIGNGNGDICVSTIELQMLDDFVSMLKDKDILTGINVGYKPSKNEEFGWFELNLSISSENNFKQLVKPEYQNDEMVLLRFNESHKTCFNELTVFFNNTTLRNKGTIEDPHKLCFTVAPIVPKNEYCSSIFISYKFEDAVTNNKNIPYIDVAEEIRKNSLFMQMNRYFISYLIDECDLEDVLNPNITDLYYSFQYD